MDKIDYTKQLTVKYTADVFVAGGGPAGIAAAVMCAGQGKRVLLIEQSGAIGGSGVNAMVPEIMNFDDGVNFLAGGFGRIIHDSLYGECLYRREWINVKPEPLKRLYDDMLLNAGVKILLYTRLTDVVTESCNVKYAVLSGQEGVFAVSAKVFIDCTGNGSLCRMAGADSDWGDDCGFTMPATLCSLWGGVDFNEKKNESKWLLHAYENGIITKYDTVLPGIKPNFPEIGIGGGNVGHCFGTDDRSSETLTEATISGRMQLAEYERYYRTYVKGCEGAELILSANQLGIRETYRIKCEKTLDISHFSDGYKYRDEIGRYSYPVDIHPMTPDKNGMNNFNKSVSTRHANGESYSIPYGCLVPEAIGNLLVAGRCIGADRAMVASARVIPCCYITGQAAGIAAALCVENSCLASGVDRELLRERLRLVGAYILD